jgi:hypothetical protein
VRVSALGRPAPGSPKIQLMLARKRPTWEEDLHALTHRAPREVRPRRKRADRTGSKAQIQSVLGARSGSGSAACSGPVGVGAVRRPRSRVRPAILWRGVRFSLTWFSACAHVGFWFLSGVAGATLAEKKCWYVVIRGRCACVCTSGGAAVQGAARSSCSIRGGQ